MHPRNPAIRYQQQEILSEGPMARIARVYEMSILEVNRARVGAERRDLVAKARAVNKAARCISLLQCSLNVEEGGDVAKNLDRLYGYLLRRLSEAHCENDGEVFGEVARHLSELGSAWREVAKNEQAPAATPPMAEVQVAVAGAR